MTDFLLRLGVYFVIALFIMSAITNIPRDDSDPTDSNKRSGMAVLRDNLTGCEYLSRLFNITPRLGRDGKQICREISP